MEQVTKVQLEKEISETDAKVDTIIKARFDESLQEENEKS